MKRNILHRIIFYIAVFVAVSPCYAQSLPRVLVIDFKNKSGNASVNYLEVSITEALQKEMQKRLSFEETRPEVWQKVAHSNYIFEYDWHTDSAAMNIGLLTRQDVTITGSIREGNDSSSIKIIVSVFDIGSKKKVEQITQTVKLSGDLFNKIEAIAVKAVDITATVLPNQEKWDRQGLLTYSRIRHHQLYVSGVFGAVAVPEKVTKTLQSDSLVSAENFPFKFGVRLNYQYDQLFHETLFVWASGGYEMASLYLPTNTGEDVAISLAGMDFTAGGGYHLLRRLRWKVSLLTGLGIYRQNIHYDYESATQFALNTQTGKLEKQKTISSNAILLPLYLQSSYRLLPELTVYLDIGASFRFFQNTSGFSTYTAAGVGYRF